MLDKLGSKRWQVAVCLACCLEEIFPKDGHACCFFFLGDTHQPDARHSYHVYIFVS